MAFKSAPPPPDPIKHHRYAHTPGAISWHKRWQRRRLAGGWRRAAGGYGCFNLICLVADLTFSIACFWRGRGGVVEKGENGGDPTQASAHSARGIRGKKNCPPSLSLSHNFDCPPCRQLDPQLLKYKTHTGTHKSVRGGVILNAGLLFNPGHIDYSCQ